MKLGLRDRLVILNVLPPKGDLTTLRIVHDLKMKLALTEEELKEYNVQEKEGQIFWDSKKELEKGEQEFEIGTKSFAIIMDAFKKLDEKKELTEGHLETYEKLLALD
ncbi:MAG: hypothetical protein WC283_02115 [Candidatus Paceibacterota bacterium]|jgi:hypothetical protein